MDEHDLVSASKARAELDTLVPAVEDPLAAVDSQAGTTLLAGSLKRLLRDPSLDTVGEEFERALLAAESGPPGEAALATREAALVAREAAAAADARLRAADATLAPHVEAGRVLPAERAALVALLGALDGADENGAEGAGVTVAFASPSGGEERMRPAVILERFIEGLPRRVDYRTLAGGPVPGAPGIAGGREDAGENSERIAAEARELMAAEAERGLALTPAEAVDRARARRGLGIEGGTQ